MNRPIIKNLISQLPPSIILSLSRRQRRAQKTVGSKTGQIQKSIEEVELKSGSLKLRHPEILSTAGIARISS